ncbi:MAG: hypothetical protein KDB65_06275 [Calditrichaeota bacterium]|nr:hypothetical protein [Calditrichota bacterium]MCB9367826.1 hypothetical protein [Calditrichota bacterium]
MPISSTGGLACDTVCIGGCFEPGSYFIVIEPSGPVGSVTCANGNYTVTLDCQPCIPCPECGPAGVAEGEPCPNDPDTFNGGCTAAGVFVSPIECGMEVCGTSWAVPQSSWYNVQDVDVYELVLAEHDSVVWRVHSNVAATISITEPLAGCAGEITWATSYYSAKCESLEVGVCLPPGTYWLKINAYSLPGYCEPYTARVDCYPCSAGCVECPLSGTAIPEGEPCPNYNDQYNSGCYSYPPSAVHVHCGDTICGSSYHHDLPDWDFYEVTITSRDTLTWCVTADFDVAASIMMAYTSCTSPVIYTQGTAPACVPLCLSICLDPGIYWLTVLPTNSADFGSPPACKEYVASVNCAPCPGGQTCIYPDLDFDPANDACGFNNVQLTCTDTICGEIVQGPVPDDDWYTFEIPAGTPCQRVLMNVYGNDTPGFFPFAQGLDPAIQLYAADCTTLVGQDNNGGFGNDALLTTTCLTPGWYHIRVAGVLNTVGPYVLSITCFPCACPPPCPYQSRDFEPANDACSTAPAEFICGDTLCGEILLGPTVDQDWYLFFVFGPNCQRITLDVFANGTPGYYGYLAGLDPVVELWDAACTTQIALDDNSGIANDSRLVSACLSPGQYMVRIAGVGGSTGPYVFSADCHDCPCNTNCPYPDIDIEPLNNTCTANNPLIACSDTACGEISQSIPGTPPDQDWYSVLVPSTGCYSLIIDVHANDDPAFTAFGGGLDPNIWLYAADCATILEFDYDSGIGSDARLTSGCLQSGLYNFMIESNVGTSGPYVITVTCQPCHCPCQFDCDASLPSEGEPCPNLFGPPFNEGCNSTPPTFSSISCGDQLCGTSWAMGGSRDTDWYEFTLTAPRRIQWRVRAEFPYEMSILHPVPDCSLMQSVAYATGFACQSKQIIRKCLPPGTYYLYVAPTVYNGYSCSDYQMRLSCGKCFVIHVVIHKDATGISLNWEPDDTEPVYYVHRSTRPDFEPSDQTVIGTTTEPFFRDDQALGDESERYFYVVTMYSPEVEIP